MQLFSTAPSFDDPIELLIACHNQTLEHCDTLARLPGHLSAHGSDDEARLAIKRILRYFHTAARLHHADLACWTRSVAPCERVAQGRNYDSCCHRNRYPL